MRQIFVCIGFLLLSCSLKAQIDLQIYVIEESIKLKTYVYGENHEEVLILYADIAEVYYDKGDYGKALEYYQKELTIKLNIYGEKHASTALSYSNIGNIYQINGDYDSALYYRNKALEINLNLYNKDYHSIATCYNNIGTLYIEIGDYHQTVKHIKKALEISNKILAKKYSLIIISYSNLGSAYDKMGDYLLAMEYYKKALVMSLEVLGENHFYTASIYNNIASLQIDIGEYSEALKDQHKSLSIYLNVLGEKHYLTANSINNIGSIYEKTGDYDTALKYFEKALNIRLDVLGKKHPSIAISYNNIGSIYFRKADYPNALIFLKRALDIDLEIWGKRALTPDLYNNIGSLYGEMGNYSKALEYILKGINIKLELFGENHHSTAESYDNIGVLYSEMQDFGKALTNHKKAFEICLEILPERHPSLIKSKVNLALSFEDLEQYNIADSIWNSVIPDLKYQRNKNYIFLPTNKKMLYLKTTNEFFEDFYHFMIRYGSDRSKLIAADLLINTKAQILDYAISTRQLIENINNENLDSITFQLNIVNQKVAKAELLSKEELKQKGWSLDTLYLQQDNIGSKILEHPKLKDKLNPQKVGWHQIQEKLQADEALLDYFTFYDKLDSAWVYQAMLIKKDEPKPLFIPISKTMPVIQLLEVKSTHHRYFQYKETRKEMYKHVWEAVEPHLKDIKTIHLIPAVYLTKIDFESLQNEEGQYLANLYDFHYYSSSKDFYNRSESQPDYDDATLYGHIAYYIGHHKQYEIIEDTLRLRLQRDTLIPLPATLHEVNAIKSICAKSDIHPTLLTINAVKEDTIAYFSGERAPGIIHFATHGAYLPPLNKTTDKMEMASLTGQDRFRAADNPLQRSMLMLSNAGETWQKSGPNIITQNDGILTALEVTNLDLSNTELVVLSACNSGIGSQHTTEGVFGLPRAFKLAGVDKILVSLWPVEDETTKELMILFYTNLLQHKQNAAAALRNAKAEMRKRDDRPKKWAGFVLVE